MCGGGGQPRVLRVQERRGEEPGPEQVEECVHTRPLGPELRLGVLGPGEAEVTVHHPGHHRHRLVEDVGQQLEAGQNLLGLQPGAEEARGVADDVLLADLRDVAEDVEEPVG